MRKHWRRYLPLYVLLAITIVPVIGAYVAYYVVPPAGRTNYGALITPPRPVPNLSLSNLDGTAFDFRGLAGRWVFVMVDGSQCDAACAAKLLMMRQQRIMANKERENIERVWLISDREPLPIMLMREYEGTHFVRASPALLRDFLVLPAAADAGLQDHIWLIDPQGHLMLRWPKDAEPKGVQRDMAKLLKVAAGWIRVDARPAQPDAQ